MNKPHNTLRQAPVPRSKEVELEEYARSYFKYSLLLQEQGDAIRHLPKEVYEAHAKVTEEHYEQKRHASQYEPSFEELQNMLKYYGRLCENAPQTLLELS